MKRLGLIGIFTLLILITSCNGDEPVDPVNSLGDNMALTLNIVNLYPEDFHPEISRNINEYYVKISFFRMYFQETFLVEKYGNIKWPLILPTDISDYPYYHISILGPGPEVIRPDIYDDSEGIAHRHLTYRPYFNDGIVGMHKGKTETLDIEIKYCPIDVLCSGSHDTCKYNSYEDVW